jgi:hypothetical protein
VAHRVSAPDMPLCNGRYGVLLSKSQAQ